MYSVIIQNQKTFESFQKFHPLFLELLNKEEIGVCRWVESGTTIDTALPELLGMIEEKEEWRAIIVHLEDEECMKKYKKSQSNPYDFTINKPDNEYYGESEVPLVRLTHMLGGVPTPDVVYESIEVLDGQNNSKIIYKPIVSNEKKEIYKELIDKYDFDGKKPEDVILVTIREVSKLQSKSVLKSWQEYTEIQSSNFWKYNHYYPGTRFITYDFQKLGKNEYEADLFKFWNIVLLLCINNIDPNELQAYRLYKADIDISKNTLNKQIQQFILRLNGEKQYIDQIVQQELNKQLSEKKLLPQYQIEIPIVLEQSNLSQLAVNKKAFHLISKSRNNELNKWESLKEEEEIKLRSNLKQTERLLDESAERMHGLFSVRDSEVLRLNKYQKRELTDELSTLYEYILYMQKELKVSDELYKNDLNEKAKSVRNFIRKRLNGVQVKEVLLIVSVLIAISLLPAIFYMIIYSSNLFIAFITALFLMMDVVAVSIIIILLMDKQKLDDYISSYNHTLSLSLNRISKNRDLYSKFLSAIASHSRGCSYLQILEYKKFVLNNLEEVIQSHSKSIDLTLVILDKWQKAFYLNKNKEYTFVEEDSFDIDIPPINNRIYTFEYGNSYQIPMNSSGIQINSSFEFIKKFSLTREEIYDGES